MSGRRKLYSYAAVVAVIAIVIILGVRAGPGKSPAPAPPAPPAQPETAYKTTFHQWSTQAAWQPGAFGNTAVTAGGAVVLSGKFPRGTDAGGRFGASGTFYAGTYTTPVVTVTTPFNWAVASWNIDTPPGTWLQVEMRALRSSTNGYTKWYNMGVWASGSGTIRRHSVGGQSDADGSVDTDTLKLKTAAAGYQLRATLCTTDPKVSPTLRRLAVVTADSRMANTNFPADRSVWGTDIKVPERSQMIYGDQGLVWCSPTSTSMLMAYWAGVLKQGDLDQSVPDIAATCYDNGYGGTGNWPFNTAVAAAYGLEAYVTRMQSLAQVEQWIKAGIPIALTISFKTGDLTGAPPGDVPGHLIVIRGFDAKGDVICNDPEFTPSQPVRIVYRRDQLEKVWRDNNGVAYIVYPKARAVPDNPRGSWE